jgi:O-antigen/teichoic acid export membrane protein
MLNHALKSKDVPVAIPLATRITANFIWAVAGEATAKGVFFAANIYLARVLGVSNFGIFALAQATTTYIWLAADIGIRMYGVREVSKNKEDLEELISSLLTIRIISGTFFFCLYTIIFISIDMPVEEKLAFIGCGIYLLTYSFYIDWIFRGLEKFQYIAIGSFVYSGLFMGGVLMLVRSSDDLVRATFVWSLSFICGSASLFYFLYKVCRIKFRPSFGIRKWFGHLRESIYFSLSSGFLAVTQYIPILLLGIFFESRQVGLFSAPYRLISMVQGGGFMVTMAFYPVFSELFVKDRAKFDKTHRNYQKIMLFCGIPVLLVGILFSKNIMSLLFGYQYIGASRTLQVLSFLVPLYFVRSTFGIALFASGLQRLYNVATFLGAISTGALGLYLIPRYSLLGGALTLLLAETVMMGSMGYMHYKYVNNRQGSR